MSTQTRTIYDYPFHPEYALLPDEKLTEQAVFMVADEGVTPKHAVRKVAENNELVKGKNGVYFNNTKN